MRLVEGLDYYMESGKFVLTEHYLRSRGRCCEAGCRHCPWGYGRNSCEDSNETISISGTEPDESANPSTKS